MSDNSALHAKVLSFIAGEFAKKAGFQCVSLDLLFSPGNGFRDEQIRKWVRTEEPDLFDNFVNIEKLVTTLIEIAEGEADAKPAGKHRFIIRTHQHLGDRATMSFSLSPTYSGGDETSLVSSPGGGGSRIDVIANHAHQLMRVNASMFEGTIRVLGAQNTDMRQENAELRAENIKLRHEVDEARSNKMDREFQLAMAAEKNQRTNAGFAKLLQIGSVVAAKIGGGDEGGGNNGQLAVLVLEFGKSLRQDQQAMLMQMLDMGQKMMFMQILDMVTPKDAPGGPTAPPGGATNGNSGPTT
jgi:regulator of replication initiation timing